MIIRNDLALRLCWRNKLYYWRQGPEKRKHVYGMHIEKVGERKHETNGRREVDQLPDFQCVCRVEEKKFAFCFLRERELLAARALFAQ